MEHSLRLLDATLDGGLVQKISDWEPEASPVPDTTPDGRPMEGNTYLERSALGVSLDSELVAGMSNLEPLEQSVLNTLLVTRPSEASTEKISDWEPATHPAPDAPLYGRLREGNTYLEHSALGVSLDSGLMEGMSSLELLEQSVLDTWLVARPVEALTETDTPERQALAAQVNHGHSKFKLSARPMLDPDQVENAEVDTDLSDNLTPMTNLDMRFLQLDAQSCPPGKDAPGRRSMEGITEPFRVELSSLALAPDSRHEEHLPSSEPLEQSVLDVSKRYDNLKSSKEMQFSSDPGQSSPELEDAIRREVLRSCSMRSMSSCDVNGRLLSPEYASLSDTEMSLDQVRSEGLRQWNMDMDVEYQYETFNGLPMYYSGDMYDSEDPEEYDPFEMARAAYVEDNNFVPEGCN